VHNCDLRQARSHVRSDFNRTSFRKISKIGATRVTRLMSAFTTKMQQIRFPLGLRSGTPNGPNSLAVFKGPTSKGEGKWKEGKGCDHVSGRRRGRTEGKIRGKGRWGTGRDNLAHPKILTLRPLWPDNSKLGGYAPTQLSRGNKRVPTLRRLIYYC